MRARTPGVVKDPVTGRNVYLSARCPTQEELDRYLEFLKIAAPGAIVHIVENRLVYTNLRP